MPGLREAGLAGAALALTGGVVYALWTFRDSKKRRDAEKVTLNADKQDELVETRIRAESACEPPAASQVCFNGRRFTLTDISHHHGATLLLYPVLVRANRVHRVVLRFL